MKGLRLAMAFLTSLPVRAPAPGPGDLGRAAAWFPFIGLVLGAMLAAVFVLSNRIFSPLLAAGLVVAAWAGLTGGLHLDGLADCCDGLLPALPPERRLDVMRDPRLGAFGVTGLSLFLILKTAAVAALPPAAWSLFPFTSALARWLILLVARLPAARPGGMADGFAAGLSARGYVLAALIPLGLLTLGGWRTLAAALLAHLIAGGIMALARSRLGGVTGDVFGLTVEVAELACLLAFAAR